MDEFVESSVESVNATQKVSKCRTKCSSMLGLSYAFLSAACYSAAGLLVKFLQNSGAGQVLLMRYSLQYVMMLPIHTKTNGPFVKHDLRTYLLLIFAMMVSTFAATSYFFSVTMLPLGDAAAIHATHVVMVGFFAHFFLKEKCRISGIVFALIAMAGVVLVSRPTFLFGSDSGYNQQNLHSSRTLGATLAVSSALLLSTSIVAIRKFSLTVHYSEFLFLYSMPGIAVSCVFTAITHGSSFPCMSDILFMAVSSCSGLSSTTFKMLALKHEAAGPVSIVRTSQVVFAFLFEYLFVGVVSAFLSVIGASLITFSCISVTALNTYNK